MSIEIKMCPNSYDPNSKSSSDVENISTFQQHQKLLLGATYRKQLVMKMDSLFTLPIGTWNLSTAILDQPL